MCPVNITNGNICTAGVNQGLSNKVSTVSEIKVMLGMSGRVKFHQANVNPAILVLGEITMFRTPKGLCKVPKHSQATG